MSSSAPSLHSHALSQADRNTGQSESTQAQASGLKRRHGRGTELRSLNAPSAVTSQQCHCKSCPVVKQDLLYYEEESESISQYQRVEQMYQEQADNI